MNSNYLSIKRFIIINDNIHRQLTCSSISCLGEVKNLPKSTVNTVMTKLMNIA